MREGGGGVRFKVVGISVFLIHQLDSCTRVRLPPSSQASMFVLLLVTHDGKERVRLPVPHRKDA